MSLVFTESIVTVPSPISANLNRAEIIDDLPAPVLPTMATRSEGRVEKETSRKEYGR